MIELSDSVAYKISKGIQIGGNNIGPCCFNEGRLHKVRKSLLVGSLQGQLCPDCRTENSKAHDRTSYDPCLVKFLLKKLSD